MKVLDLPFQRRGPINCPLVHFPIVLRVIQKNDVKPKTNHKSDSNENSNYLDVGGDKADLSLYDISGLVELLCLFIMLGEEVRLTARLLALGEAE